MVFVEVGGTVEYSCGVVGEDYYVVDFLGDECEHWFIVCIWWVDGYRYYVIGGDIWGWECYIICDGLVVLDGDDVGGYWVFGSRVVVGGDFVHDGLVMDEVIWI